MTAASGADRHDFAYAPSGLRLGDTRIRVIAGRTNPVVKAVPLLINNFWGGFRLRFPFRSTPTEWGLAALSAQPMHSVQFPRGMAIIFMEQEWQLQGQCKLPIVTGGRKKTYAYIF